MISNVKLPKATQSKSSNIGSMKNPKHVMYKLEKQEYAIIKMRYESNKVRKRPSGLSKNFY